MASAPKFRVGEEVVVQSISYPKLNGCVFTVLHVLTRDEANKKRQGEIGKHITYPAHFNGVSCDWFYVLDGLSYHPIVTPAGYYEDIPSDMLAEGGLRRYHRPADQSYEDLMDSLKPKVTA